MKFWTLCSVMAFFCLCTTAMADTIVYPSTTQWISTGNSGGGSSAITDTMPDGTGGQGSLEMTGDRTRFVSGNPWGSHVGEAFGKLSDVESFAFSWNIAMDSVSNLHPDYTPALRLHLYDPNPQGGNLHQGRSNNIELIWEGAYNGAYGSTTKGTWYTSGADDDFWRYDGGVTLDNGAQQNLQLAEWSAGTDSAGTPWFSGDTLVMGLSLGVGSSAGEDYHAFTDMVTLDFAGQEPTTYNFEPNAVPIPPSLLMFGAGFLGLVGLRFRNLFS
ncbi:hypothetical protein [Desulfoplanes sp.]